MKRRNFLKLIPVGFLAAKFGGLIGSGLKTVPFEVEILPIVEPGNPLSLLGNMSGVFIKHNESDIEFRERILYSIKENVIYV
ncbi:MAG: hypothetical protein GWP06_00390 [Actinobacteria bacterium]|nr:hypothetical protein [Actinomycetota bacterium]